MNKNTINSLLAASLITTSSVFAGETTKSVSAPSIEGAAIVTGTIGVNVASGYVFRGQLLDSNLAYQPNLSLKVPLNLTSFGIDNSAIEFTTLQSLNQNAPLAGWYRSESVVGVSLAKGAFVVTPSYEFYNSPTSKFESSQGVGLKLSFKEGALWNLNPYVKGYFGVQGNANNGTKPGCFYEGGIRPSFLAGKTTVSIPVSLGFGTRNYYANNSTYGYVTTGIHTSTPITSNMNFLASVDYWNTGQSVNSKTNTITTSLGLNFTF